MKNLTHIFRAGELSALHEFLGTQDQLAIIEREIPGGSDDFFHKLMRLQLSVAGRHKQSIERASGRN